jgi:DNA-directed RNA polymerase
MLSLGAAAYVKTVERAKEKRWISTTRPVHNAMVGWAPAVSEEVAGWIRHGKRARAQCQHTAYAFIKDADPKLLALIGLREVLDCVYERASRIGVLAHSIGQWVEHELKMRHWEERFPKSYRQAQRYLDKEGSAESFRARVNQHFFNQEIADWPSWPREAHFRVGEVLIDAVVRGTHAFNVEYEECTGHELNRKSKRSLPYILVPKPGMLKELAAAFSRDEQRPRLGPTIMPPRPWHGNTGGGYWTHYTRTHTLVNFKASHQEQRDAARMEYDALSMPEVQASVNYVQNVPWKINRAVLAVVEECWKLDLGIGKLPAHHPMPDLPRLEEGANPVDPELLKRRNRKAKNINRFNKAIGARLKLATKIVQVAGGWTPMLVEGADPREGLGVHYYDDRIYFPHKLDFRGRMYSIPGGLSPQGHDLARGLLLFADSKPILKENGGRHWLALQVANMLGKDKLPTAERVQWVEENKAEWLAVAADPVGHRALWSNAKSPWQGLAAILDWAGYLTEGEGYRSSLPITVDGTCNGLQHLITLTKDHKSAHLVNLTHSDSPHDIYGVCAGEWQAALEKVRDQGEGHKCGVAKCEHGCDPSMQAAWFLSIWAGTIPRGAAKKPVMVLPYGGTRDSFFENIQVVVDEESPAPDDLDAQGHAFRSHAIVMASKLLWAVVNEKLPGAMAIMAWLQECSRSIVSGNQPVYWVVPSGFVVRHFYGVQKEGQIKISINGRRLDIATKETTKVLDAARQTRGVPPNFVHSLDACALSLTINRCAEAGITHITAIHDAYGSHASDMTKLSGILRQAFVDVHESNPLDIFWAGCQDILEGLYLGQGASPGEAKAMAENRKPPLPPMGHYDVQEVRQSEYFFS